MSLFFPLMIPALIMDFSFLVLLIWFAVIGLFLFRFFVVFQKTACVHCAAKKECLNAQAMGLEPSAYRNESCHQCLKHFHLGSSALYFFINLIKLPFPFLILIILPFSFICERIVLILDLDNPISFMISDWDA